MKKILFLLMTLIHTNLSAQIIQQIDCGTKVTGKPIIFTQEQKDKLANVINTPYTVKIFVTVFADDNGSNRATTDADVLRQVQNMANQYQPQNICFILGGIRQLNNSDLNDQDADDSTEKTELPPVLVNGFLNIFIHKALPGYNGNAYAIPNTYLSMSGSAMESLDFIGILAHEMGHCLGLYHTFEPWRDKFGNPTNKEKVARDGDCKNCTTAGDVLCDTPADDNGGVNASCVYIGTGKDACNTSYSPLTNNLMAYGDYSCITTFTNDQGDRMRSFLETNSSLHAFLVHDILYTPVIGNYTISSGTGYSLARDIFYVSDGNPNLTVNGTANYQFQAKKVLLKSGTKFSPGVGGRVSVKSNPYCN
jgi:hypothetical protein